MYCIETSKPIRRPSVYHSDPEANHVYLVEWTPWAYVLSRKGNGLEQFKAEFMRRERGETCDADWLLARNFDKYARNNLGNFRCRRMKHPNNEV